MTEAEWQWSKPKTWGDMLQLLQHQSSERHRERKAILACCACCRITWEHVRSNWNRNAVETSERYADGLASLQELETSWRNTQFEPVVYCEWICSAAGPADRDDILTNLSPQGEQDAAALKTFHATFTNDVRSRWWSQQVALGLDVFGYLFTDATVPPAWRTDTAVALARQMYESRDFGAMPILADALQDAGCNDEGILDHCRGPGPHVRGCWVVDLVLGKE